MSSAFSARGGPDGNGGAASDDDGIGGGFATASSGPQGSGGAGGDPSGPASSAQSSSSSAQASSSSSAAASSTTGGGTDPEIPCGNDTCTGGKVCCVRYGNNNDLSCETKGQCGFEYYQVECNNQHDCPGNDVCCGRFQGNQVGYIAVECSPTCDDSGLGSGILMCFDDPQICDPGVDCLDSGVLPDDYSYCEG